MNTTQNDRINTEAKQMIEANQRMQDMSAEFVKWFQDQDFDKAQAADTFEAAFNTHTFQAMQ